VKQYTRKQKVNEADWLIGSEILAPGINGVGLRSMKDPGSAYDDERLGGKDPQPKHMRDFIELPDDDENDNGGVHLNSGIPNFAFYRVARALGGFAWEQAGMIWFQSLQQLPPLAQFQDCADITAQVAGAKFGTGSKQHDAVVSAWDEVGITVTDPQPLVTSSMPAYGFASDIELRQQLQTISEQLRLTVQQIGA